MRHDISALAAKVLAATEEGMAASLAHPNDGGSCNLDHVCLYGLRGVRLAALQAAGIACTKARAPGTFRLAVPFPGQGGQRNVGVEAMADSLARAGVDCYVHYQMD